MLVAVKFQLFLNSVGRTFPDLQDEFNLINNPFRESRNLHRHIEQSEDDDGLQDYLAGEKKDWWGLMRMRLEQHKEDGKSDFNTVLPQIGT